VPQKHGLQSLGKIPTARRAPANLPSLKAENFGNDPAVCLVPSNGSGWAGKDTDDAVPDQDVPDVKISTDVKSIQISDSKTWQIASDNAKKQEKFLNKRSPFFGHDFPILKPNSKHAEDKAFTSNSSYSSLNSKQPLEVKYGPGPSLRPQSSGHWMHGGGARTTNETENDFFLSGQDIYNQSAIVLHKKTVDRKNAKGNNRDRDVHFQHSIIDNEKLKRMDYIETNEDDWAKNDDNFDYNKKLAR
jgi:hypothetical protein